MARAAGHAAACLLLLSLAAGSQGARLQAISQPAAPQMLRQLLHAGHTPSGPQPFLESISDTPTQEIEGLISATAGDVSADSATQLLSLVT